MAVYDESRDSDCSAGHGLRSRRADQMVFNGSLNFGSCEKPLKYKYECNCRQLLYNCFVILTTQTDLQLLE